MFSTLTKDVFRLRRLERVIGIVPVAKALWLKTDVVGTAFADSSDAPKTVSVFGNAQITLNSGPGGVVNAGVFDGAGDYLEIPKHTDFDFGTGNFGVSLQYYTGSASNDCALICMNLPNVGATSDLAWTIHHFGTTVGAGIIRARMVQSSFDFFLDSGNVVVANTWITVKMYRTSGTLYLKINGSVVASRGDTSGVSPNVNASHVVRVGMYANGAPFYLNGRIRNVEVWKGNNGE